jgi:hypothetical protein
VVVGKKIRVLHVEDDREFVRSATTSATRWGSHRAA